MARNGHLCVAAAGSGEPALLFVHGFGCSHRDWELQMVALSPRFRCAALDLPGHGDSDLPREATMTALADAVNAAKAQMNADQVILVGHSLGCKVIREAYCASSADVAGLVFIEGAYYEGDRETLIRRASESVDSGGGFAAFAQRHFGAMFIGNSDLALREAVLARVKRLDATFARNLYLEAVGWDPLRGRDTLQQIKIPVLVLQSTYNDASLQRRALAAGMKTPFMEAVEQLVAQAEIKVVPHCGHFAPIEAPEVVNRELHRFASRFAPTIPTPIQS
jgi:pimeloyl-ACP methyl ester carboxylesterase